MNRQHLATMAIGLLTGGLLTGIVPVCAAPPATGAAPSPAAMFGAREMVEQISLSPDGSHVAYVTPLEGSGAAIVVSETGADAKPKAIASITGKSERMRRCGWVSNTRLVCRVEGVVDVNGRKVDFSRMFAVNADGTNMKSLGQQESLYDQTVRLRDGTVIDWLPGSDGAVLMSRNYVPNEHTGSHTGSSKEGLGVDRVDTRSGNATAVEYAKREAEEYITDGRGTVRIMGTVSISGATQVAGGVIHYFFRKTGSRVWERLSDYDFVNDSGFNPYAVDPERNAVIGLKKIDGRSALVSVALDGSAQETVLFARPDVNVDGVAKLGRQDRVVGAAYQKDRSEIAYFDPAMKALATALGRALPKQPDIRILDASLDERKLLIFASADTDPGTYYLFNRDTHDLHAFLGSRPELDGVPLGRMEAIVYAAADGTMIPAYLTLPPGRETGKGLPAIVLPHGGPSYRDEWGFDWLPQYYATQGYAVLQPEFRGSSGYGDAWYLKNGFRSWRTAIGDVADAGRWLVKQGIADPGKLAIVGWSYGGYAALQAAAVAPQLFKAVVAVAPVTDLTLMKSESQYWTDRAIVRDAIGGGSEAREGSPVQNATKITAPVLLFHGTKDANVDYAQSTVMQGRLQAAGKQVRLVTFPDLDHQLADAAARTQLLEQSDAFIRAAIGK